jgi:Domain of unknown function (DUF6089)
MRKLLLAGLCLLPVALMAQPLHIDIMGGFSNYQGDLQEQRFTTAQSRGAFSAGIRYDLTTHFAVRSQLSYGRIAAHDKYNQQPDLINRNLSFETKITELNVLADYSLFNLEEKYFTPYFFAGVAVYHYNPFAFDSSGSKIYLKPLSTEGQGLPQYPARKNYALTQIAIPFGGGIRWRLNDRVMLGYEIGLRKTFNDYLDDVSTTYVDQFTLAADKGLQAIEMAFRGGELKNGALYPADGSTRGSAAYKDWYYFSGITVSIALPSKDKGFGGFGGNRGKTACPKVL